MREEFYFVEALEDGVWRSHRQMIIAAVDARWCIDSAGVDVLPGIVYSFSNDRDANYFLTIHENERGGVPRAEPVCVRKGQPVVFHRESDAQFFVDKGAARWMSQDEIAAALAAASGQQPVDDAKEEPAALDESSQDDPPPVVAAKKPVGRKKAVPA